MLLILGDLLGDGTLLFAVAATIVALYMSWRSTAVTVRPLRIQTVVVGGRVIHIDEQPIPANTPDVGGSTYPASSSLSIQSNSGDAGSAPENGADNTPADGSTAAVISTPSAMSATYQVSSVAMTTSAPSRDERTTAADSSSLPAADSAASAVTVTTEGAGNADAAAAADNADQQSITVKLKFLNDTERVVQGLCTESLALFVRRHFAVETSTNRRVLLVFNGRLLQYSDTLSQCGLTDNCVVHCHISAASFSDTNSSPDQVHRTRRDSGARRGVEIGQFLWPALNVLTSSIWLALVLYPHAFSTLGAFLLTALTTPLVVGAVMSLMERRQQRNAPPPPPSTTTFISSGVDTPGSDA